MCKCTPHKRTPFCGAPGCEWPSPISAYEVYRRVEEQTRRIKEDIEIQIHAARISIIRGNHATACAELNGAKLMIEQLEKAGQ